MKNISAIKLSTLIVFAAIISGCSKNNNQPTPNPEVKDPPQVVKRILKHMDVSVLISDTLSYKYDDEGRVISKIHGDGSFHEDFAYSGDHLTSITNVGTNGSNQSTNFVKYSADGDTILLDFTRPDQTNTGNDTVQLTYIYKDSQIISNVQYFHFFSSAPYFQTYNYAYDATGKVISSTNQNSSSSPSTSSTFTVSKWDDKNNPKDHQPKLNHLFLELDLPLESTSKHNPLKYSGDLGSYEFVMTYNEEGYPLTVKNVKDNFVMLEIYYNR